MEQALRAQGIKLTPQRRAILAVLANSEHLTVEEIYEKVKKREKNRRTNLATVYRNLHLLHDLNLLRRLDIGDGRSRYEGNLEHHHHLICLDCGQVEDLFYCPLQPDASGLQETGFIISHHTFAAYGNCKHCNNGK
jgi:Fe2+ or Zn2+ uptake regulation protein